MISTFNDWAEWFPRLWSGYLLSLEVASLSLLIGIPLGLLWAIGGQAKTKAIRWACVVLVELGRGGPVLILLQFLYFGLPNTGLTLSSLSASIVALAWSTGAYTSEIIRAGLNAVAAGQREAAQTLGLNRSDILRIIIIPQGLRIALPPLLGFALLILQATSLCFTIALPELISAANDIGSETFQYMSILSLTGLMYALVCVPATFAVNYLERHLGRHD
ncbi:putative glutamine ABC transporter permease protein GlnP [Pseudomonas fluorescens]|uniref:Putative glutamine ABC transporter permease protein GlnP n=1 Tax=Pseudomonas fluorescens TaxID=294 RepID=A0A5E7HT26_PSEFL|nr:amino acid ABC transporter permease [Pseudomonas fluorescens]VVO67474.1 putative glutamine ABC transporter permease protein GlnP [Pseudomonas fluorescens]